MKYMAEYDFVQRSQMSEKALLCWQVLVIGSLFVLINVKLKAIQIILQIQFVLCKEQFIYIKMTALLASVLCAKDSCLLEQSQGTLRHSLCTRCTYLLLTQFSLNNF
jgi:hypothetical protein